MAPGETTGAPMVETEARAVTAQAGRAASGTSRIQAVGVIGAGVMGAGIAAHCANAGVKVVLLDLVPGAAAYVHPAHARAGRIRPPPEATWRAASPAIVVPSSSGSARPPCPRSRVWRARSTHRWTWSAGAEGACAGGAGGASDMVSIIPQWKQSDRGRAAHR